MKTKTTKTKVEKSFIILLLVLGGIIVSVPFIWMISSSFKPESEVLQIPPSLIPENPTLENYVNLFESMNFGVYLRNTLIIVLFSFVGLFFNAMAGYGFAKYQFKGREKIFYIVLATMMIPAQVTMIPVYLILNEMGLTNTMTGIVLPGLAAAFSIFLFRQFMTTIPTDLIEAARLDGAGEFYIFFRLIVPIAKPIFAVQGILTFIGAWNSFLWPLIIANDESLYTLSVGLSLLQGQYANNFGLQMAGAAFMVVPIIIIFSFFQKYIVEGFTMSGIK
ncbi:carbohydrate ABC transporter membrane protein 2 (CUT1 family) [Bacillus sp. V-88]|jgi:multiple sugar transport system permease protein|uniref:carbohydrate ABC transporter permease n=1 Tax=Rossellomorea vietnamensis TaxID=218284 RepID=UPI0009A74C07|nr:carbohydrate ABC transporter permease [Rossellomorea vietnamensis]MCC5802187.1 carbohydrate ABC transporter permease [Rossellomorea vietnamensis]OXS58542.1 sugar ABC transporter permease [Bacillus sp. DSM 27956]PRX75446.1 carbohydrate ABC transporter membrane protein 2 (CUT1 family) [Bacillus sp. V-88]SLK23665.1 carbohydrate ABC transporter membrane protein 2, CUT1 family [Bacillus sp. V-88]